MVVPDDPLIMQPMKELILEAPEIEEENWKEDVGA